ncbi:hypothetical protein ABPG77_000864 [Micractinium sp. CCAP 211/92]
MRLPPYPTAARSSRPAGSSRLPKPGAVTHTHLKATSSASSSAEGWGFALSAPEPAEERRMAATPCASPIVTPEKLPPAGRTASALVEDSAVSATPAAPAPNTTHAIPADTCAALQKLAGRLGAAASTGSMHLCASFEEAFMAGVAVGLALPADHHRSRSSTLQRVLLAALLAGVLLVLGCSTLLLTGIAQGHPSVYYQ